MQMADGQAVRIEIDGPVARVILNRPEKRNAINEDVVDGLNDALGRLESNGDVHVVLLRGEGSMFSSGIDFTWIGQLGAVEDKTHAGVFLRLLITKVQEMNNWIERIEKPVIAVLHGRCIGLGLEIALACDFRIAEEGTLMGLPEVLLGLVPDCGGTTRVTRCAGPAVAKEVVMLAEQVDCRRYLEWNLINRIAPKGALDAAVDDFVKVILDRPPRVIGLAKRLIDRGAGLDKMSHMELEALANSALILAPDFPQIIMEGIQKVRKK